MLFKLRAQGTARFSGLTIQAFIPTAAQRSPSSRRALAVTPMIGSVVVLLAYRFGESVAIHDWHVDVGQQQIEAAGCPLRQGLFAIRGDDHRAAQCFQLFLDD